MNADTRRACQLRFPASAEADIAQLVQILEPLVPLSFVKDAYRPANARPPGLVVSALDGNDTCHGPSLTIPLLDEVHGDARSLAARVRFSARPEVPTPFRGRRVSTNVVGGFAPLRNVGNDVILATIGDEPAWTMRPSGAGASYRCALALPKATPETGFADMFNGERFLAMLPLLQFLREIGAVDSHGSPPLRASYIVDDPNLHWPKYGYVDFRRIADYAQRENYHVSFATIPLDAWLTNATTALIFRQCRPWISLLVHGNNHGKEELARPHSRAASIALLRQAVSRIEHLERKARVRVARVMVPPHGACSSDTLANLPLCGFEAACVSTGSLRHYNNDEPWTRHLGFLPCERVEGCPVMPRWGIGGNVRNALLVAAFLGQAMIVRGHHHDFRSGPEQFNELAGFINSLGEVRWMDMASLARSNFVLQSRRNTCRVTPLALTVQFEVPAGTTEVHLEDPNETSGAWHATLATGEVHEFVAGEPLLLSGRRGVGIVLRRTSATSRDATHGRPPMTHPAIVLRRLLTEARDRFVAI